MATRSTTEPSRSGRAGVHPRRVRGSIGRVTNETVDVVVVGAGAMGSAAAWALASVGRDVVVLEQHALGHDEGGSHGGSRLFRLDYADEETLASALRAERLWRRLEEEAGEDLLTVVGGLEHGVGSVRLDAAKAVCDQAGVPIEIISAEAAGERWPQLAFEGTVVHQPGSGRLNPDRGLAAMRRLATERGARFEAETRVTGLRVLDAGDGHGPGLVEVTTSDHTLRARHVVVAVGSWAPALLGGQVALPTITVTQEQPRFFTARDELDVATWPVFVHWRDEPGPHGRAAGYGCVEPGVGVKVGLHHSGPAVDPDRRPPPDPGLEQAVVDYVRRWFPGLDADRSTPISCLYDNSPDEMFVVDRVGPVVVATGFSGEGFKFVPVIGELLRDLVTGAGVPPDRWRLR
jgi:sarcosine oxidase